MYKHYLFAVLTHWKMRLPLVSALLYLPRLINAINRVSTHSPSHLKIKSKRCWVALSESAGELLPNNTDSIARPTLSEIRL